MTLYWSHVVPTHSCSDAISSAYAWFDSGTFVDLDLQHVDMYALNIHFVHILMKTPVRFGFYDQLCAIETSVLEVSTMFKHDDLDFRALCPSPYIVGFYAWYGENAFMRTFFSRSLT